MTTTVTAPDRAPWSLLAIAADALDDAEQMRIATQNRIRSLQQVKGMKGTPEEVQLEQILAGVQTTEKSAEKLLKKSLKANPFYQWIKDTIGVGEKQGGRLLASIGHPVLRVIDTEEVQETIERSVSQLWSYCGYAPEQKRKKGVKSNWNSLAKMRAYLIAESCIKQMHSPYRKVYDEARANWSEKDTSDGHKHNHALRLVAKAILKDLWIEGNKLLTT